MCSLCICTESTVWFQITCVTLSDHQPYGNVCEDLVLELNHNPSPLCLGDTAKPMAKELATPGIKCFFVICLPADRQVGQGKASSCNHSDGGARARNGSSRKKQSTQGSTGKSYNSPGHHLGKDRSIADHRKKARLNSRRKVFAKTHRDSGDGPQCV